MGKIRFYAKFQVSSFNILEWQPLFVNQSLHWESHLKWPESGTFDFAPFIGIKNVLQNGIKLGVLDFRKYVKSVIPFWRAFLMPMKRARSKVPLSGHFKWLSQCQDWFTKSGCHLRILKLETWNFAWDLILPIHMLYKKRSSIWELFEKLAHPNGGS